MAETAVLGVGRNEIPPYYTELSKSTVQVLLTSAQAAWPCLPATSLPAEISTVYR